MRIRSRWAIVLALCSLSCAAAETPAPSDVLALTAARAFDGRSETLVENAVVLVQGDRIIAVGSALPVPPHARRIDFGDATLLPGLIDAHTHLTIAPGSDWRDDYIAYLTRSPAEIAARATVAARTTLDAGFTTVRDLWNQHRTDVALKSAIDEGGVPGPRIVPAAIAIGIRGGHCEQVSFEDEARNGIETGIAAGADGFRDAVRFAHKAGAGVIKLCASAGVSDSSVRADTVQMTQIELDAAVDEAHRLGLKVAVHSHGDAAARAAIQAGADSVEHGSLLSEDTLRLMKQRGTVLVADLIAADWHAGKLGNSMPTLHPEARQKADAIYDRFIAMFSRAVALGVPIAFGTDAGEYPHGRNAEQFHLMLKYSDLRAVDALRAATSSAARLLGIENEIGTLEIGKIADIVAVPGNPLTDIRAMERVSFVLQAGKVRKHVVRTN